MRSDFLYLYCLFLKISAEQDPVGEGDGGVGEGEGGVGEGDVGVGDGGVGEGDGGVGEGEAAHWPAVHPFLL